MKEKLAKLMSVKSLVTLALTGAFTYLSVVQEISSDQFLTVFSVVIAFYFGTQYEKKTVVASSEGAENSGKL